MAAGRPKMRISEFYGFERPLYFGNQQEPVLTFAKPAWFDQVGREVSRAHESAAVFDQSSLEKICVTGRHAEAFLDQVCTNDMSLSPGRATFTLMLNERGGIESDLVARRLSESHYRLYVGTSAITRDLAWLKHHLANGEAVDISAETEAHAVLALAGPNIARNQ